MPGFGKNDQLVNDPQSETSLPIPAHLPKFSGPSGGLPDVSVAAPKAAPDADFGKDDTQVEEDFFPSVARGAVATGARFAGGVAGAMEAADAARTAVFDKLENGTPFEKGFSQAWQRSEAVGNAVKGLSPKAENGVTASALRHGAENLAAGQPITPGQAPPMTAVPAGKSENFPGRLTGGLAASLPGMMLGPAAGATYASMVPLAISEAGNTFGQTQDAGATLGQSAKAATVVGGVNAALGVVPVGAGKAITNLPLVARFAVGAGVGELTGMTANEGIRRVENAVLPDSMQQEAPSLAHQAEAAAPFAAGGALHAVGAARPAIHDSTFNKVKQNFVPDLKAKGQYFAPSGDKVTPAQWKKASVDQRKAWLKPVEDSEGNQPPPPAPEASPAEQHLARLRQLHAATEGDAAKEAVGVQVKAAQSKVDAEQHQKEQDIINTNKAEELTKAAQKAKSMGLDDEAGQLQAQADQLVPPKPTPASDVKALEAPAATPVTEKGQAVVPPEKQVKGAPVPDNNGLTPDVAKAQGKHPSFPTEPHPTDPTGDAIGFPQKDQKSLPAPSARAVTPEGQVVTPEGEATAADLGYTRGGLKAGKLHPAAADDEPQPLFRRHAIETSEEEAQNADHATDLLHRLATLKGFSVLQKLPESITGVGDAVKHFLPNAKIDRKADTENGKEQNFEVTVPKTEELPAQTAKVVLAQKLRGQPKPTVHIDISEFKGEGDGTRVYQAIGDWAHNNGYEFIADPAGMSFGGATRRTEHILSNGLKHGTTDHMSPGLNQMFPENDTVHPLVWSTHDFTNLSRTNLASTRTTLNQVPEAETLRYNFKTRAFEKEDGTPATPAYFQDLSDRAHKASRNSGRETSSERVGTAPGVKTLKRAVLQKSLMEDRGRTDGSGGRSPALAFVAKQLADQKLDPSVAQLYYKHGEEAASSSLGMSRDDVIANLRKEFGSRLVNNMVWGDGRLVIVPTKSDIPPDLISQKQMGNTAAVHLPAKGVTVMVADRIKPENLRGTFLHEVGEHFGITDMLNHGLKGRGKTYNAYLEDLHQLHGTGNPEVVAAFQRVKKYYTDAFPEGDPQRLDPKGQTFWREVSARLVETAPEKLPWLKGIVQQVRAWAYRAGLRGKLSVDDVRTLAAQAIRREGSVQRLDEGARPAKGSRAFKDWETEQKDQQQTAKDDEALAAKQQKQKKAVENLKLPFRQEGENPVVYSGLHRAVNEMAGAPKSAPGKIWSQWLDGLQRRGLVKTEEREDTGIDKWLADQPGKVSREQLQQYVAQHQAELKSGPPIVDAAGRSVADRTSNEYIFGNYLGELRSLISGGDPEYTAKLEEHLNRPLTPDERTELYDGDVPPDIEDALSDMAQESAETDEDWVFNSNENRTPEGEPVNYQGQGYALPGGKNYHERLLTLPENKTGDAPYKSNHWMDNDNVLAHWRANERDVGGKPSYHVEEVQSDWHQKGQVYGYGYGKLPDAPFKKSWHLLAMKHAIAEAVRRGKSRVSFTPGDEQATRWGGNQGLKQWYDGAFSNDLNKYLKRYGSRLEGTPQSDKSAKVPYFDITPALKQTVEEGQPLYRRGPDDAGRDDSIREDPVKAATQGQSPDNPKLMRAVLRGSVDHAFGELDQHNMQVERGLHEVRAGLDQMMSTEAGAKTIEHATNQWETGQPVDNPQLKQFFDEMKKQFDVRLDKIITSGRAVGMLNDYFPHLYKDPNGKAKTWFQQVVDQETPPKGTGRRPLEGGKGWTKERVYNTLREAREKGGLEPISNNPADMMQAHIRQLDRYLAMHQIHDDLAEAGYLIDDPGTYRLPAGYQKVGDPAFHGKLVPDIMAHDLDTVLGPSLNDHAWFRTLRRGENAIVSSNFGFSGFHATLTTVDTVADHLGNAIIHAMRGDIPRAATYLGKAVISPVRSPFEGRTYALQSLGEKPADAETAALLRLLVQGGHRMRMSHTELNDSAVKLGRLLRQGAHVNKGLLGKARVTYEGAHALFENLTPLIHKYLVPYQKMTAKMINLKTTLDQLASTLHDEHGNKLKAGEYAKIEQALSVTAQRQIAGRVVNQVDSRLGQFNYRRLYMNRTLRDVMQALVAAPGWQIGSVKTILGGAADARYLATGGPIVHGPLDKAGTIQNARLGRLQGSTAYLIGLHALVTAINIGGTYAMTGEGPKDIRDLYTMRTGRVNDDGTPERFSFPSYLKDEVEAPKNPLEMVMNKLQPLLHMMGHLSTNRDYFGDLIIDHDADPTTQAKQYAGYFLKTLEPYSFEAISRGTKNGTAPALMAANLMGVQPAPGYMARSPFMQYLSEQRSLEAHAARTPDQVAHGRQRGSATAALRRGESIDEMGLTAAETRRAYQHSRSSIPTSAFKRLPVLAKLQAWSRATPAERTQYNLRQALLTSQAGWEALTDEQRPSVMAQLQKIAQEPTQ